MLKWCHIVIHTFLFCAIRGKGESTWNKYSSEVFVGASFPQKNCILQARTVFLEVYIWWVDHGQYPHNCLLAYLIPPSPAPAGQARD